VPLHQLLRIMSPRSSPIPKSPSPPLRPTGCMGGKFYDMGVLGVGVSVSGNVYISRLPLRVHPLLYAVSIARLLYGGKILRHGSSGEASFLIHHQPTRLFVSDFSVLGLIAVESSNLFTRGFLAGSKLHASCFLLVYSSSPI